jgi:hypothetical protein
MLLYSSHGFFKSFQGREVDFNLLRLFIDKQNNNQTEHTTTPSSDSRLDDDDLTNMTYAANGNFDSGIGNQLFFYASLYGIAKKNKKTAVLDADNPMPVEKMSGLRKYFTSFVLTKSGSVHN